MVPSSLFETILLLLPKCMWCILQKSILGSPASQWKLLWRVNATWDKPDLHISLWRVIKHSSSCCGTVSTANTVVSCRDIALAADPRLRWDRTAAKPGRCCQGVPVGGCTLSPVFPRRSFCLGPLRVGDGEEMSQGCWGWCGCQHSGWGHSPWPWLAASPSWDTPVWPCVCSIVPSSSPSLRGPQSPPLLSGFSCAGLVEAIRTPGGGAFAVCGQTTVCS